MPAKSTPKRLATSTHPVEDKAWELYLRLTESPAMAGKTQDYVVTEAFNRAQGFVDVARGRSKEAS